MTARTRALPLLLLGLTVAAPLQGQGSGVGSSGEGALFLLLPVGAQAVALGRAMTAVEGAEGAFWNPAGLAGVERSALVVFRGDQVAGTATAVSGLFTGADIGTAGVSYLLLDVGDQDLTDAAGNVLGTVSVRNHLGIVSAATRLAPHLSLGVSFKVVQFRLSCRGSSCPDRGTTATTYAFDAGLQGTPLSRLRLGAMVAHVGPRLQVRNAEQADPLPLRLRVAASYDAVHLFTDRDDFHGWFAVEVQDRVRDLGVPSLYLGTELTAGTADQPFGLSVRAGYVLSDLLDRIEGSDPEDGARVGLGVEYDRIQMSIAKSLAVSTLTGETEPVHVTLSIGL
ncbi:MAG: hypothetical protein ABL963_06050 [Longimicrobiales bacterium]